MGSRFEDDKGPIADWELVAMRDTDYDAEIVAAEERGRQEAAARIALLEAALRAWKARIEGPTDISMQEVLHMTDAALDAKNLGTGESRHD